MPKMALPFSAFFLISFFLLSVKIKINMPVLKEPNLGKNLEVKINGKKFLRFPVKTQTIFENDNLLEILEKETKNFLKDEDIVILAESVLAIVQKRSFKFSEIKFGFWAKFLSKYVKKTKAGIGLSVPQTMQLAINEVGILRILSASFFSVIFKIFKIKGAFYILAGEKVRGIDGPTENTIPPYNEFASLIPQNSKKFSLEAENFFKQKYNKKIKFFVVDANDIGVNILSTKNKKEVSFLKKLIKDNPMGQDNQSTPFFICRLKK